MSKRFVEALERQVVGKRRMLGRVDFDERVVGRLRHFEVGAGTEQQGDGETPYAATGSTCVSATGTGSPNAATQRKTSEIHAASATRRWRICNVTGACSTRLIVPSPSWMTKNVATRYANRRVHTDGRSMAR